MLTVNEKTMMLKDIMCSLIKTGHYKYAPDMDRKLYGKAVRWHWNGELLSDAKQILADIVDFDRQLDIEHDEIFHNIAN